MIRDGGVPNWSRRWVRVRWQCAGQPKIPRLQRSVGNPETGPWLVDESSLNAGQRPQCVVSAHVPPSILKSVDLHGPGQSSSQSVDLGQVAIFLHIASLWSISHSLNNVKEREPRSIRARNHENTRVSLVVISFLAKSFPNACLQK